MTMKRYINLLLAFCVSALTLQSCFQDMDHPAFDYPDSSAPKVFSPMKLFCLLRMICVIRVITPSS